MPEGRLFTRPYSLTFGALVATRRMRALNADNPPTFFNSSNYDTPIAYTPEFTAAGSINLLNYRPDPQRRSRFSFDLGIGVAIGRFSPATICYRVDGAPCIRETANVYTNDSGGSPVDPFFLGDLYWDSDTRYKSIRLRIGYGAYLHPAQVSSYSVNVSYSDFTGREDARIDRTSGRLYVLYYL